MSKSDSLPLLQEETQFQQDVLKDPEFVNHRRIVLDHAASFVTSGLVVDVDKVLGEVLTIIDTLNLPEKQDKAIKDLIKARFKSRMLSFVDALDRNFNSILNAPDGPSYAFITGYQYTPSKKQIEEKDV